MNGAVLRGEAMDSVRVALVEWCWFGRVVARFVVFVAASVMSCSVFAQASAAAAASGVQFSGVVCGPAGLAGVTYVTAAGAEVSCGTDSAGDALVLQVSTLVDAGPVEGGEQVGLDIGAAVFLVLAAAFGLRLVRRIIENGSEG